MLGAVPELAASWQFLLVAGHFWRNDYDACAPVFPRTAILIPAWNEAAVIGASIDRLMALEYPRDALRVYLVDDADVIFEPDSLRKMARHLADPQVGAVTTYIKEGSRPGNYMTRFIGYEYITAQAAARRGQNVLGAMACLAGGAQLHTRANLLALGGRIDTTSLAEDTFLQPVFLIVSSFSLVTLYFSNFTDAWLTFHVLWIVNAVTYIWITAFALLIDPQTGRHTWREGTMFPGVVNLSIVIYTCFPRLFHDLAIKAFAASHFSPTRTFGATAILFIYAWPAASMAVAYLAKAAEPRRFGRFISPLVVYVVGYGTLLCACTFASYVKELRGAEMKWDKTEKTGKVTIPT